MTLTATGVAVFAIPVLIGVLNAPAIRAQSAPAATPKFEVVSIKPCEFRQNTMSDMAPEGNSTPGNLRTGCFSLLNASGRGLIRGAYASNPFTPINGGPSWIHSAAYEINAVAEGSPSVRTMNGPMMLLDAGFRRLGDLRWVSERELRQLRYIGIKNAQQLRDVLRRFDQRG
jgi:hypothetical protein